MPRPILAAEPDVSRLGKKVLSFDNVSLNYDGLSILDNVSFEVERGEFVALIGPSGCGKTTLLNLAAGLATPASGTVRYAGEILRSANTSAGYLTQEDALLPWRDVISNVSLPLEIKGVARAERVERARAILAKVGLKGFERHKPHQLSGGMRKRVSLARTLIYQPETLLLDEPFGALDAQTRVLIQEELLSICKDLGLTVLLVTHDIVEAIGLADRVVLISKRPARLCATIDVAHVANRRLSRIEPQNERYFDQIWDHLRSQTGGG